MSEKQMKILGLVSLLVALLIVAVLSKQQLAAVHAPGAAGAPDSMPGGPVPHRVDTPTAAQQVPQQVHDDVSKMMQDRTSQVEQSLEGK